MSNTKFQYLHVSSESREIPVNPTVVEAEARMSISLQGHQIKNIKNVAVSRFSINNSLFNVTAAKNKLTFRLVRRYTTAAALGQIDSKEFFIQLQSGYYETKDLIQGAVPSSATGLLNSLFKNQLNGSNTDSEGNVQTGVGDEFKVGSEDVHSLFFSIVDFNIRVSLQNTVNHLDSTYAFVPCYSGDSGSEADDLWLDLGFTREQISKRFDPTRVSDTQLLSTFTTEKARNNYLNSIGSPNPISAVVNMGKTKDNVVVLKAHGPSTIENIQGLYLMSRALTVGKNTYESSTHTSSTLIAKPMEILEFIQFDKEHYSTISYQPNVLHYHEMGGVSLNEIDIYVANHNKHAYKWKELGRFNLVLQFECYLDDTTAGKQKIQYEQEAYQKAHTLDNLIISRR